MLPPLAPDEFPALFEAIHGQPPFPWQSRLVSDLATKRIWPEVLDLPTASGKTAAIDAALFHLALEAGRGPERQAPLRIVFVVDRRIIVDAAAERAAKIAQALEQASGDTPLARMAARLRHLAGDGPPLMVNTLRGGVPQERDWTRSPGQPTVLCSTVDQVGSRLLFRGYGVSDAMKPVHAGLLGSDALFLLDEAHLAGPFAQTLGRVAAYRQPRWCQQAPGPWGFVSLSATPQQGLAHEPFALNADDRANPVLQRRLTAAKPAALQLIKPPAAGAEGKAEPQVLRQHQADAFVSAAWRLFSNGGVQRLAVVVNRVDLARRIFTALQAKAAEKTDVQAEVILLTGRIREVERGQLRAKYQPRLLSGAGDQERPLLVVATQTIEAGADFDFDALVSQIAPLDALRQRFGRLNRLGRPEITARAVIVATKEEVAARADDPVYGDRAKHTWDWLLSIADKPTKKGADPVVDFGIEALEAKLPQGEELARMVTRQAQAPILRPADLELLSCTAPVPAVDPAASLFLHGSQAGPAEVQIVWRADLTPETLGHAGEVLTLLPPHGGETLAVPLWAARAWLRRAPAAAEVADLEGRADPEAPAGRAEGRAAFRWAGPDSPASRVIAASELRPGDLIVVPATYGGCDEFGWHPEVASPPVEDLGEQGHRASRVIVRRFHPALFSSDLWHKSLAPAVAETSDQSLKERVDALEAILKHLPGREIAGDSHQLVWPEPYKNQDKDQRGAILISRTTEGKPALEAVTEGDQSSTLTGQGTKLTDHQAAVAEQAGRFARTAGLSPERAADVLLAAELHDGGKADPRFQAWLLGGDRLLANLRPEPELLAKSAQPMAWSESRLARREAGLPQPWRHEVQSVQRALADPRLEGAADAELVLWLIGVHHGQGRPLFDHDDRRQPDGPARLDWSFRGHDWPQLFQRLKQRYGPWELARLEAIMRLADHRASEENNHGR